MVACWPRRFCTAPAYGNAASLTRAPTDSLISHISVETLCDQATYAALPVIGNSAAALEYDEFCVGANRDGVFALLGAVDPLAQKISSHVGSINPKPIIRSAVMLGTKK